jgi:hypothetical protein
MRLQAICPFEWKGGRVLQPGTVVEPILREDDELAQQWIAAGFAVDLDAQPPQPPASGNGDGGEGGATGDGECGEGEAAESRGTPPMMSTDMPSHVGRRTRS